MLEMFPKMTGWFNTQGAATEETTSVRDNDGGKVDGDSATEEEDQSEAGYLQEGFSTTEESTEPTSPSSPRRRTQPTSQRRFRDAPRGCPKCLQRTQQIVMLWELYHRCPPMHAWPSIDTATIVSA